MCKPLDYPQSVIRSFDSQLKVARNKYGNCIQFWAEISSSWGTEENEHGYMAFLLIIHHDRSVSEWFGLRQIKGWLIGGMSSKLGSMLSVTGNVKNYVWPSDWLMVTCFVAALLSELCGFIIDYPWRSTCLWVGALMTLTPLMMHFPMFFAFFVHLLRADRCSSVGYHT